MPAEGSRIGIFGAGAVGGYVGGHLTLAGYDVTLIGQWPENVEHIKREGLLLTSTLGSSIARPTILHLHEVQSLIHRRFDVVFICVKSYDTEWATSMISSYIAPTGYVISMQNGVNEERIARIVGWGRTLGVVLNTIGVGTRGLGVVKRTSHPAGNAHMVFRVGEVHGRITPRALYIAKLLSVVDSSDVTTNLWGERWSKLVTNSISHGLSILTGLPSRDILASPAFRRSLIKLAAEGISVGEALGYALVSIYGAEPDTWKGAANEDPVSLSEIDRCLSARLDRLTEEEHPSAAQDIMRGRRTEIDFTNGHIVATARRLRFSVPAQEAVLEQASRVERGVIQQSPLHATALV